MNKQAGINSKSLLSFIASAFWLTYAVAVIAVIALFNCAARQINSGHFDIERPDFSSFQIVSEKKAAFFDYIAVLATAENQRVAWQRKQLLNIDNKMLLDKDLTPRNSRWLSRLTEEYRVDSELSLSDQVFELKSRVNIVPVSLVQAQAAIESGWGTSRFAIEGNNLFGQWCFSEGCGIVPSNRLPGRTHEVAVFPSDAQAIRAYMLNLNSFNAYKHFRSMRSKLESDELSESGFYLAGALGRYSERGADYVGEVKHMISSNKLEPGQSGQ